VGQNSPSELTAIRTTPATTHPERENIDTSAESAQEQPTNISVQPSDLETQLERANPYYFHSIQAHPSVTALGGQPLPKIGDVEAEFHPIRRVGDDMLGSIFHWAVYIEELYDEPARLPYRTKELGQVCRRWRFIVHNQLPRLWSRIVFIMSWRREKLDEYAEWVHSRVRDCLRHVYVTDVFDIPEEGSLSESESEPTEGRTIEPRYQRWMNSGNASLSVFISSLPRFHRVRSFNILSADYNSHLIQAAINSLPLMLNEMKEFGIASLLDDGDHLTISDPSPFFIDRLAGVETLSLINLNLLGFAWPIHTIRALRIEHSLSDPPEEQVFLGQMLEKLPNLESLYLDGIVDDASEPDQGFALLNLRKLHTESMESLRGCFISYGKPHAPHLEELRVDRHIGKKETYLLSLLFQHNPSVRRLNITLSRRWTTKEHHSSVLATLLGSIPLVEVLVLGTPLNLELAPFWQLDCDNSGVQSDQECSCKWSYVPTLKRLEIRCGTEISAEALDKLIRMRCSPPHCEHQMYPRPSKGALDTLILEIAEDVPPSIREMGLWKRMSRYYSKGKWYLTAS